MKVNSTLLEAVILNTGWCPEFVASNLGIDEVEMSEKQFLSAIATHWQGWANSPYAFEPENRRLEQFAEWDMQWRAVLDAAENRRQARAQIVWRAITTRVNASGNLAWDEDPLGGFDTMIRECLSDEGTLIELLEIAVANASTVKAKEMARSRHTENHAMKAQVLSWYSASKGQFRSKDAAAQFASTTLVPVTFRTVREWLKTSRSACAVPADRPVCMKGG